MQVSPEPSVYMKPCIGPVSPLPEVVVPAAVVGDHLSSQWRKSLSGAADPLGAREEKLEGRSRRT